MKGKIIYTAMIEKEIEIPDEIIELSNKSSWDRTKEQEAMLDNFVESVWSSVDYSNRIGMYYEVKGYLCSIEEY